MTAPCFDEWVDDYLALRRGLGFDLQSHEWFLRDFARYAERVGHRGPITIDLTVRWALASRSSNPAQAARRLGVIRSFARHRAVLDPATEIPAAGLLGRVPRRKLPHIYSESEITALLREAALLQPRGGLCPRTYVAFFSLLASSGLRLSEACHLVVSDVDLAHGLITVRHGKFRKSRQVPLHPSATRALADYATYRDMFRRTATSNFFFRTDRAPALTSAAVEKTFSRIRHRLGWTAQGRARRPRIHDIRHTVAVCRLLRWYEAGADVDCKMLALSTFLGHAKVTDTYWYVSAIPELMAIASQHFERSAQRQEERAS